MNLSYFISKRIRQGQLESFSSIIHKIAVASIAVGLSAAIVSFLIMYGFQSAVKNKIYGFSNHLLITKFTMSNAVEEQPFDFKIDLYEHPEKFGFVKHVQEYIHKPGLIKTDKELLGIVFKGVGKSFNKEQFNTNLVEGRFINFSDSSYSHEVLLSRVIADKMNVNLNDDVIIHFFQNPPRFRKLKVVGIYETNLSDYFDSKFIIGDIKMLQQLNKWKSNEAGGLEVSLDMNYFNGTELWLNDLSLYAQQVQETVVDNPEVKNKTTATISAFMDYKYDHDRAVLDESLREIGDSMDYDLNIETVRDKFIQVFEWLDLVDRQVKILLVIILVVVCVNMISVILILVMERTQMVGILKAIGAQDSLIRSVFVYNGVSLIGKGLLYGNMIGLGFCYLQYQFRIIKLNPHDYYIAYVPIEWTWTTVIMLNLIVLTTVTLVLIFPTRFIIKISPIKAIRFD